MDNKKNVNVIIAAGGAGKRVGSKKPKQFLTIEGKAIICKSIEPFYFNDRVDKIYLIVPEGYVEYCKKIISNEFIDLNEKSLCIIEGGKERQDSIYEAIKCISEDELENEELLILVHDGARPYLTQDLVERTITGAELQGAVIPILPVTDTVRIKEDDEIKVIDRNKLMVAQTPQGFKGSILINAYEKAMKEEYFGTDDGQVVQWAGFELKTIEGEQDNKKITVVEDLPKEVQVNISIDEKMASNYVPPNGDKNENKAIEKRALLKDFPRIGSGYDVHKLVEGRELILGGVQVPFNKGLDGHSDADVLVHAIMDAILGAAALGDIGKHFPPSDMKYKGVSSLTLLSQVKNIIKEKGYVIGNIDATVVCEKPKISDYVIEMKNNICEILELDIERLNIKGTTTEKLGFTGREEGIAAEAICLLAKE